MNVRIGIHSPNAMGALAKVRTFAFESIRACGMRKKERISEMAAAVAMLHFLVN